jgi:hypothetical protein
LGLGRRDVGHCFDDMQLSPDILDGSPLEQQPLPRRQFDFSGYEEISPQGFVGTAEVARARASRDELMTPLSARLPQKPLS